VALVRSKVPLPSTALPTDLVQIGYRSAPHPLEEPLDAEECRTALWLSAGNITRAAKLVNTNAARLGNFVRRNPYLGEERLKAAELAVDRAEAVVLEALEDTDAIRRDDAARFVLTHAGRMRGWSKDGGGAGAGLSMSFSGAPTGGGGMVQIRWQTSEEAVTAAPKVIDHA